VIAPRARKYKVNQVTIVKKLMGEDFLEKGGNLEGSTVPN
jgi:hypothetical protein